MKHISRVALIFLAFLVILVFGLFLPENTQCELDSILLQENVMSSEWMKLWMVLPPALPKKEAEDALGVVYEKGNEIVQHKIYKYKNGLLAFFSIRINNQLFFPSGQWLWCNLGGSEDWVMSGDEKRIRCGDSDDPLLGDLCVAVIRYGPYISEFSSPIEEGVMSQEEFKAIVLAIDERIASCLQQTKHQR